MVMKQSRMLPLGTPAPDFELPDGNGERVALRDFDGSPALLVAFICNHCPFVKHILGGFVRFALDYAPKGLAAVAISANDAETYPDDGPAQMAQLARAQGFNFPYLYDETQAVAKAYEAVCTPDFFLFDRQRRLVYRGQFDSSRPSNAAAVTGADLRAAADAVLTGREPGQQLPSVGCNIKWKSGQAPAWG